MRNLISNKKYVEIKQLVLKSVLIKRKRRITIIKKITFVLIMIILLQLVAMSVAVAESTQPNSLSENIVIQEEGTSQLDDSQVFETEQNGELGEPVDGELLISEPMESTANANSTIWATANKATNIVSAPYDGINTKIASLNSGDGFAILVERDYGYFYIQKEINGKYRRGYVKMSDVNYSSYSWVNHNIFEQGVTRFTASSQEVLSGPGTTNTYEHIGTIYKNESPLLVLRTELNTYNNVTYCFIQYKVSGAGQFKRGWVPYSAIGYIKAVSSDSYIDTNKIFYLESAVSGKVIQSTADTSGKEVTQQPKNNGGTRQLFKIEKASTGYYRFILQSNTNLSLQVLGNQMAEGATLGVLKKGTSDAPSKAEEFEVQVYDDGTFYLRSRCTGRYNFVSKA